jgi:very-short-patch-repair endonuclease
MNVIPFEKSFASHEKSQFWSDKNCDIRPSDVKLQSNKKYWFDCIVCNHSFECSLSNIVKGNWCGYCSGRRVCGVLTCVICYNLSFASHNKSQYWSDKNEYIKPINVKIKSNKKYWFDCIVCNHSFESILTDITNNNSWCGYCTNRKLCEREDCVSCFDKSFASHEKSQYWSNKNVLTPRQVFRSSATKYIFHCNCGHEIIISPNKIYSSNYWCSYCCEPSKELCNDEKCKYCFNKSFASHEKSKYWSNKNELMPRQVFKSSSKKYIFDCIVCYHSFESVLSNITSKDCWCSYCSNRQLCECGDCVSCFDKSFASHEKSQYWSNKNELMPRQVFKQSNNKYIFNCECEHEIEISPNNNTWCVFCANKKLCNEDNCKKCFDKSFASNEKSKYWSNKNELIPRQVFNKSSKKCWFTCNKTHTFCSTLAHIAERKWCPFCVNKTETKLYEKIQPLYSTIITQFKQEWCKKLSYLPFDFCIPEYKIIIELDGPQHFRQISNWSSPEEQFENDKYKEKCANDNGYSVIRFLQEDVFYDTYDWVKELCETIEEIKNGDEITNVYLCKNGEYDAF